jgi:hypothetical protein
VLTGKEQIACCQQTGEAVEDGCSCHALILLAKAVQSSGHCMPVLTRRGKGRDNPKDFEVSNPK